MAIPRYDLRVRRRFVAALAYMRFALAGVAVCALVWWPLLQADQARAAVPKGGSGAAASVHAARAPAKTHRGRSSSPWARIAGDAPVGLPAGVVATAAAASPADLRHELTVTVALKRTDQAGFNRYLREVYDRHSPLYMHYLTQAQLAARFGPSSSEYHAVKAWLVRNGMRVTQTAANRLSISARGSEAEAERAFDVPIATFRAGRELVYGNTEAPAVPRALAPDVQAVMGLSDRAEPAPVGPADQHMCDNSGSLANTPGNVKFKQSCSNLCLANATAPATLPSILQDVFLAVIGSLFAGPIATGFSAVFYYGGYCLGTALASGNSGFGNSVSHAFTGHARHSLARAKAASASAQKLGLLEFDAYNPSDVTDWLNLIGLTPSLADEVHEINVNGGVPSPGSGESEVLLDIDTALAGAELSSAGSIDVYEAPPSTSFVQMFQAMLADGDTVVSNSWSQCEDQTPLADAQAIDTVLASAEASGVTVVNGTGDSGSTCLDGSPNTIGVPADSPHATAVGGTSLTFGPGFTYGSESWWDGSTEDPATGSGGFGVSRYFTRPSFQSGLAGSSMRSVPDMSLPADPHVGLELCQADAGGCPDNELWGGTSMAAPELAAEVADLNEAYGRDVGNLNAALYPLAGTDAFHNAASMDSDFAHVGLGSPDFGAILERLTGSTTGAVSPTQSVAGGLDQPQADGSQQGVVRVDLEDANGLPVSGKTVTITPNGGSSAVVAPTSATTDTDGAAAFTVTDTTAETVTFTVEDTTDGITLTTQPTLTFVTPVATGASIGASPSTVPDDGTSNATITVYLENALGQPAAGKTVSLTETSGSAAISPSATQVTGSDGKAVFSVTDTNAESASFTATDVTDGNLPVPGSASVNFEPPGPSPCSDQQPTAEAGYSLSGWASGGPYNAYSVSSSTSIGTFDYVECNGVDPPAFDSSGNAYVGDSESGQIYVLGPGGGAVGQAEALPDTTLAPRQLGQLAFGNSGELYATLLETGGDYAQPALVQLDPSTGATERTIVTTDDGLPYCPSFIAVDPLSGDVFTTDYCTGSYASDQITRVSDPDGPSPTVSGYADVSGRADGLAFAPDGTLYVAVAGSDQIVSVTGTNGPATPVVTTVATLPDSPTDVAVAATDSSGHATALDVTDSAGNIERIDLTANPATVSQIATGGGYETSFFGGDAVGPDGCLYTADLDLILKVTGSAGCSQASAGPELVLQQSSGSSTPATGSSVGFTATLANVSDPSGTPVHFTIAGPNLGARLGDASGGGQATTSYSGVFQGVDTVTASAVVNGATVTSAPVEVHWVAGKATAFLDLDASQLGGQVGRAATVTASLWDETQMPVAPVAGQPVTLGLGGVSCSATTNSSGVASCKLTPKTVGLLNVTASYAGSSQYTAASATNVFDAATDTVAINVSLPRISGKAKAKSTLTCTTGTWSNGPYAYEYQWNRNGTPIQGATKSSYKVVALDEGSTLTCSVVALNIAGKSDPATSRGVKVSVPHVKGCPAATGKIAGTRIGLVRLGMTRKQAKSAYKKSSSRGFKYKTFFCLTPEGVRVGYGSPLLLRSLSPKQRPKYSGRVVWISTSNPTYAVKGVRAGATLAAARKRLKLGKGIKIGLNDWYLARDGASTAVLKVRHGLVEEIGIATKALTRTRKAQRTLMSSFD